MLKVEVDLQRIKDNCLNLQQKTPARIMAVVKADAYGHGLEETALCLAAAGVEHFGVGSVQEALCLRKVLPRVRIYSLLGPLEPEDYKALSSFKIIPCIHSREQFMQLRTVAAESGEPLPVALKLETGMNRLGFRPQDLPGLMDLWARSPGLELDMLASHLCLADVSGGEAQVRRQLGIFMDCCRFFRDRGCIFQMSLANSAALLAYPETHLDIVRPGISLYGDNPFAGTHLENRGQCLGQAMQVSAPVLAVHELKKGQGVSYGLCFTAPRDMRIAVIGCGYADYYSRRLSNIGWMFYRGGRLPVLGRVCMQLSLVDATHLSGLVPGEQVWVLGGQGPGMVSAREMAGWWGTISYEVFCLLGQNPRTYRNG